MEKDIPKKEEVWIRIAVACTSASNSTIKTAVVQWADYISEEYSKRFQENKEVIVGSMSCTAS